MSVTDDSNAQLDNAVLYCSIVGFAAISWLLWKFILSPSPARQRNNNIETAAAGSANIPASRGNSLASAATSPTGNRRAAVTAPSSGGGGKESSPDDGDDFTFGEPRHPSHFAAPANWRELKSADMSGCLLQGIVPFRCTPAAGHESRLKRESSGDVAADTDLVIANRRERARVFARMFSSSGGGGGNGGRPPNRGANIVVTIQHADVSCTKLQKALFLLGTYYNLFLLIDGSDVSCGKEEMREVIKKSRSELLNNPDSTREYKLHADVLPPHRIAYSSSSKGRVAFVRQLHGAELIVDFDDDVTKELERFKHRVLPYPKTCEGKTGSALGNFLIP